MSEDNTRRQSRNESRRNDREDRQEDRRAEREGRSGDRREERRDNDGDPGSKRPSHIAFHVRGGEDAKAYFNRIGSAFPHKDGEGYNILLDAVPTDGKVTLRTPQERLEDQRNGNRRGNGQRDRDEGPSNER